MQSWSTRFLIAGGVLFGGGYVYWRWDTKRKRLAGREERKRLRRTEAKAKKKAGAPNRDCLAEYLQPDALLSAQVKAGLTYALRHVAPSDVIGLNSRTQARVFGAATRLANAGETGNMDRAVKLILREVMTDCPWDTISWPPEPGSDWADAYDGVEELLQLAALEMRYEDYHQLSDGGAGLVCPGWNNVAPAPTGGLRPDDLIEVQIGAENEGGEPVATETAYATVLAISGDMITARLVGNEVELAAGMPAPALTGGAQHGYRSGMEIYLHRRCVYSVRKMP